MTGLTDQQLRYGFWPSLQLSGSIPKAITFPNEFHGGEILNIACTQTGLTASKQKTLIQEWCELLPSVAFEKIVFSSKVNQTLFEAAVANQSIDGLFVKWSSVESIEAIAGHTKLRSLYLGSSPRASGLDNLETLPALEHLFLDGVIAAQDLSFLKGLEKLKEFGLARASKPFKVESLAPIANLQDLLVLWLVRIGVKHDGLAPLKNLKQLRSLRTELDPNSKAVVDLRASLPKFDFLQPVW